MFHDFGGHGAQQHRLDRPVAPAPDDDHIGRHGARSIDDGSGRATAEDGRLDVQAGSGQAISGLVNGLVSLGSDLRLESIRLDHRECRPRATEQSCARLDRLRHEDLGPRRPGNVGHELDTKRCRLGAFGGDEDSHRSALHLLILGRVSSRIRADVRHGSWRPVDDLSRRQRATTTVTGACAATCSETLPPM